MTHVLIATPTAGGVVKSLYATTLVKAVLAVKDAGWSVDFVMLDGSYVSTARNYFANVLLRQPHFTHLVMIDSDMSFDGGVICRYAPMWQARRRPPLTRSAAWIWRSLHRRRAIRSLHWPTSPHWHWRYTLEPELEPGTRQVRVIDGMCRVNQVAMGCAAIQRDAVRDLDCCRDAQLQGQITRWRDLAWRVPYTISSARSRSRTAAAYRKITRSANVGAVGPGMRSGQSSTNRSGMWAIWSTARPT